MLRREALTELTGAELGQVVAGGVTRDCVEPPSNGCVQTFRTDCVISQFMDPCLAHTVGC